MIRVLPVLLALVLAGCTGKSVSYDKEVDDLGVRIVTDLKAQPAVSDAAYRYEHGVDLGQHLRVRAILRAEQVSPDAIAKAIDLAAKEFWLSAANIGNITITVYSAANPPTGDDDNANKDRAIGRKNIEDSPSFDRPEMEKKYGPRPTRR